MGLWLLGEKGATDFHLDETDRNGHPREEFEQELQQAKELFPESQFVVWANHENGNSYIRILGEFHNKARANP